MKSRVSKLVSMLCVAAMLVSALPVSVFAAGTFTEVGGWLETIYAEIPGTSKVTAVSYSGAASGSLTGDDLTYLVKTSGGKTRIDIPGVAAGTYTLNVTTEGGSYSASNVKVYPHDRSGYAHFKYTAGVGAYKDDGTLKANAKVLYVTDANKDTVSVTSKDGTTVVGIGHILNSVGADDGTGKAQNHEGAPNNNKGIIKKLAEDGTPLVVRIVGRVTAPAGLTAYDSPDYGGTVGDNGFMARMKSGKDVTIEGVGVGATMDGWGLHFMAESSAPNFGKSFEVRNLTFENVPEDCVGMEGVQASKNTSSALSASVERCWIHNCKFYAAQISNPAESDKADGDGACDFKRGRYMTMSYCEYYGCHKTNLIGSADYSLQYDITWHHNYYENCKARGPLVRNSNIHIYNTWYRNQVDYAQDPRADAYIFSEYNVFDNVKSPGAGASGGVIKSYHDSFAGWINENNATVVTDKSQKVPNNCKFTAEGIDYSSFDTNSALSYIPTGDYLLDEDFETMKRNISAWGGPMEATVRTPEQIGNTTIIAPMEAYPAESLQIDADHSFDLAAASGSVAGILVQDGTALSSGMKLRGSTKTQPIIFTVDNPINVEMTSGSGSNPLVLVSEWGETFITGSGSAENLPAGTYFLRVNNFQPGDSGKNYLSNPTPKSKDGTLNSLKITTAVADHTHDFSGAYKSFGGKHARTCLYCSATGLNVNGVPTLGARENCAMKEIVPAVAMDCRTETPGKTAVMACSKCNYQTGGAVIPVEHHYVNNVCTVCNTHRHTWETEGTVVKAATCVDAGEMVYHCTISGCTATISETIPPTGVHTYDADDVCTVCHTRKPTVSDGQYVHNFTTDEKTDAEGFFSITGNMYSGNMNYNYNGIGLTKALKMESSTVISFTAPSAGKVILVVGDPEGHSVKVNDKAYSCDENVVAVDVAAGAVTVKKGSGDTRLLYVEFVPEGSSGSSGAVNKAALKTAINNAADFADLATSADGSDVAVSDQWTTAEAKAAFTEALAAANGVFTNVDATQEQVDAAATALNKAIAELNPRYGTSEGGEPVGPVGVTAVVLSRSTATLKVGGSVSITATVSPSNAADKTVTWTSSNDAVATVANGVVTAKAVGTANITATAGGKSAACVVTVKSATSEASKEYFFKASDYTANVTDQTKVPAGTKWVENFFELVGADQVEKEGSNPVAYDTNQWRTNWAGHSYLLLLAKGQAGMEFKVPENATASVEVTFTSTSGKNYSAINLLKGDTPVAGTDGKTIYCVQGQADAEKTVTFTNLEAGTYQVACPADVQPADVNSSWTSFPASSDNPNNRGARIASVKVTVKTPSAEIPDDTVYVDAVTVTPATANLNVGGKVTLTAAVTPANATNKTVTWDSSNAAVATVANGVVTAVAAGEAIITATADGVNGMCTVTVKGSGTVDPPTPVKVERRALTAAIASAEVMKSYAAASADGSDVLKGSQWVTQAELDTFAAAIAAAQTVHDDADATQAQVNAAVTTLKAAADTFHAAHKAGTEEPAGTGNPGQPENPGTGTKKKVYTLEADVVFRGLTSNGTDDKSNPIYNFAANEVLGNQGTENFFSICGNKDASKTKVDFSAKTFSNDGYASEHRINFGGTMDAAKGQNAVKFTTNGPAEVKVWWVQGGEDNRPMAIMDSTKAVIDETSGTYTKNSPYFDTLTIPAAGTYFLGGKTGNNNIYKVEVTVTETVAIPDVPTQPDTPSTPDEEPANTKALTDAIAAAKSNRDGIATSTNGSDISKTSKWVMKEDKEAYTIGILAAEDMLADANATQAQVDQAVADLANATKKFDAAKAYGTKSSGGSGGGGGGGGGGGSTTTKKPEEVTITDTFLTLDSATTDNVAVAELTDPQANTLTNNAVKNNSKNIIVSVNAPKSAGTVRLNVSADALKNMSAKTDAALTVETPAGDVKLPSASLADLGSNSGRTVAVLVSKTDNGVKLTIGVGNKIQDKLAGGVTAVVEAAGSGSVAYLIAADGSEKLLKKSYVEGGHLHANLPGSGTIVLKDNAKSFRDVEDNWAKSAIDFAASRELFNGVNELDFAPNQAMTRSMLVTVLYRLEGAVATEKSKFADVPADSWYAEAVAWANTQGIVSGKSATHFGPNDDITREQLATILYRYATKLCGMEPVGKDSKALEKFSDQITVSDFAVDGMKWCVEQGIIGGRGDGTLAPGGFASRAEVATMLMRFVKAII